MASRDKTKNAFKNFLPNAKYPYLLGERGKEEEYKPTMIPQEIDVKRLENFNMAKYQSWRQVRRLWVKLVTMFLGHEKEVS